MACARVSPKSCEDSGEDVHACFLPTTVPTPKDVLSKMAKRSHRVQQLQLDEKELKARSFKYGGEEVDEGFSLTGVQTQKKSSSKDFAQKAALSLHAQLGQLYGNGELTDLTVKVGDNTFQCHQVVMAATSGFFQSLLASGMRESQNGEVVVESVSEEAFELILSFIYSGKDVVSEDNVDDLLKASVILQMKLLEERCVQVLMANLLPENCIGTWKLAQAYGCELLVNKAHQMLVKKFSEISQMEEFQILDREDLVTILETEGLMLNEKHKEDTICEAVLLWVEGDPDNRESHLVELLDYICLPLVSGSFLFDRLYHHNFKTKISGFGEKVEDALCYHLKPEKQQCILAKQSAVQNLPDFQKVVVLISGSFIEGDALTSVVCYDLKRESWFTLASIPYEPGLDFATCTLDNEVYISGGARSLDGFAKFCPGDNEWIMQPSLITGRECHAMVTINDCLYVLGGRNSQLQSSSKLAAQIESYDTKKGRWFDAGRLECPLESLSAAAVGSKIYTFGGTGEDGEYSSIVQCFDITSKKCQLAGSFPVATSLTKAVTIGQVVYIVCPEGQVCKMSVSSDGSIELAKFTEIPDMHRNDFGLYVNQQRLMIVGGRSGVGSFLDDIVEINLTSGKVKTKDKKLPIPIGAFSMETVVMPKAVLVQSGFNLQDPSFEDFSGTFYSAVKPGKKKYLP